jgi:hypothetical protein
MEVAEEFLEALQRCVEVDHEAGGGAAAQE